MNARSRPFRACRRSLCSLAASRATSKAATRPQPQSAEAAIAPILTTPDAHRHAQLRQAAGGARHPCRARPHRRFRRQADRRHGDASTSTASPDAKQIVLDDNGLEIESVTDAAEAAARLFTSAPGDENLGAPLADRASAPTRSASSSLTRARPRPGRLLWLTPAADRRQEGARSCSARANRSRTGPGSRPRIRPRIRQSWEATIHVARRHDRGDERAAHRAADHPGRRKRLQFPHGPQRRALHDRDCGRRPGVQAARAAHRRVGRAGDARRRRARAVRHRENGRRGGEALRPLPLGPLRRARAAAVLSARRHGKSRP